MTHCIVPRFGRRKAVLLAGFLSCISAFGIGMARAASLADIQKAGVINVASEDDFQPFEFVKDGVPTGYDVEFFDAMSKSFDFKVHHEMIPWTGILPGVTTGKYDIAVTAVLVTPERLQSLGFTSPVAESVDYYVKRASDDRIKSVADLNGLTLGVEAGSAMLKLLPQLDAMLQKTGGKLGKVVEYQDYPTAYQDLAAKRLDFVVNTYLNLQDLVTKRPGVFALGQAVSKPIYIAWATTKDNTSLLKFMDDKIAAAKKDGTMAALQKKWFGTTFDNLPVDPSAN